MLERVNRFASRFFSGDPSLFGGGKLPNQMLSQFRQEQIDVIARLAPAMMIACICNAVVALVVLNSSTHRMYGAIWAFVLISISAYLYLKQPKLQEGLKSGSGAEKGIRRAIVIAGLLGVLWTVLPFGFYGSLDRTGQVVVACLSIGVLCGGALVFSTLPAAAISFIFPVVSGTLLAIGYSTNITDHLIMLLVLAYTVTLVRGVVTFSNQLLRKVIDKANAKEDARKDTLTGLMNRKAFEEFVNVHAIAPLRRNGSGFAVFYLDLDHFKTINDTYGHDVGDELLRQVASRLTAAVRPNDCVARVGGDEFSVVCQNVNNAALAAKLAERILRAFDPPIRLKDRSIQCRQSIGIALAPVNGDQPLDLMKNADIALYQCKQKARGTYAFFTRADDERIKRRNTIGSSMRKALENGEFYLEYQPIFTARPVKLSGFEALVRWKHPELGLIPPMDFILIAEELDLIHDLGNWIIKDVCRTASNWPGHIRVSINFSTIQLRSPRLVQTILETMEKYSITPERIEIELTETISLEGNSSGVQVLQTLREHGMSIALDDFGTGYSSLSYLCTLPIDRVKIDRSFTSTIFDKPESMAIIHAILGLARSLNIQVVAEGIETQGQLDVVAEQGCEEIQGFLLSRPLSEGDATEMCRASNLHKSEAAAA